MSTIEKKAPSLGSEIVGELDDGFAYFRGIPYATVEKRWTHSRPKDSLDSHFDATEFGPRCVQLEGEVLVSGGETDPTPGEDEFNCLNLNISVPEHALKGGEKLPVMFWIHGGAFNYGANSVSRYRPNKLAKIAADAGTPVVIVQIGYRLQALGFAASNDIASEQAQQKGDAKALPAGAFGFVDQRNALKWVNKHIADFGGDPSNITAFGISAGSASVHYHILTGDPMFDRGIMMSGAAPTIGPLPFASFEKAWEALCDTYGLKDKSPAQRLEFLRKVDAKELCSKYVKAAMGPVGDGTLLPASWKIGGQHPTSRCKSIILGDTRVEGIIFHAIPKALPQSKFRELVKSVVKDPQGFLKAFGFSEDLPQEKYAAAICNFLSVMMFQYSNLRIAEGNHNSYYYHFEETSPYPGLTYGVSYHGQCALYMYNMDTASYPAGGKHVAHEMARIWTAYAYGKEPWEAYDKAHRFMRFGPDGDIGVTDVKHDKVRDYSYLEWLRNNFDDAKLLGQKLLNKS